MKTRFARITLPLLAVAVAFTASPLASQTARRDPAFDPVTDVPSLPRVLLIGDSISIGYTVPAQRLLSGKANVHRIPENGGPTPHGIEKIDSWLEGGPWDLIHFNWGLHDLKIMEDGQHQVPIDQYEKNLRQLVARLKETGATLVWASTTPVPRGKLSPPRRPEDVAVFNKVALRIMKENDIPVDDLYTFALPRLTQIQRPANVHYTEEGYNALAGQVAKSIAAELAKQ